LWECLSGHFGGRPLTGSVLPRFGAVGSFGIGISWLPTDLGRVPAQFRTHYITHLLKTLATLRITCSHILQKMSNCTTNYLCELYSDSKLMCWIQTGLGTLDYDRTVLYKTKALDGTTKPNTNPNPNPTNTNTNNIQLFYASFEHCSMIFKLAEVYFLFLAFRISTSTKHNSTSDCTLDNILCNMTESWPSWLELR